MEARTSTSVPQDLASLARITSRQVARWTFGMMALSLVIKLALAGG